MSLDSAGFCLSGAGEYTFLMKIILAAMGLACLLAGCGTETSGSEEDKVRLAFLEYDAAVKAGNLDALKARVAGEKAAELSKPEAPEILQLAARMRPADATIAACKVTGDRAGLELRGTMEGQSARASASMVRENGVWRLSQESWTLTIDLTGGAAAPPPDVPPPLESMPAAVRKLVDAVASSDAMAGSAAWSELGTRYPSASSFLKDVRPALWDERPVGFIIVEESFKGGGRSFRYFSSKVPTPGAVAHRAKTVGESLRYHLWRFEDAGNSGFKGTFAEWWAPYARSRGLPAFQ